MRRLPVFRLLVTSLVILIAKPAFAYLDPGTGSFACQMLLGALVGAAFIIKINFQRIKAFLSGWFSKDLKE